MNQITGLKLNKTLLLKQSLLKLFAFKYLLISNIKIFQVAKKQLKKSLYGKWQHYFILVFWFELLIIKQLDLLYSHLEWFNFKHHKYMSLCMSPSTIFDQINKVVCKTINN